MASSRRRTRRTGSLQRNALLNGRCLKLLLGLGLSSALALPSAASESWTTNWPSYRGDSASGRADAARLPSSWNVETGEGVAWKTPIPGLAHASPIVWGDTIYLLTARSKDGKEASLKVGLYGDIAPVKGEGIQQWLLLLVDRTTGAVQREIVVHEAQPKIERHTKATHANSTPATDGKRVAVMLGSEGLHVFDLAGEKRWSKDFGTLDQGFFRVRTAQWGWASSPILHDDKVYIQADVQDESFVAAFDAETGDELWRTAREEVPTWSTPAILPRGDGLQLVLNGWKHIGGYDPATGEELWKLVGGGDIPVPTPIGWRDVIVITNAHGPMRPIYAIDSKAVGLIDTDSEAIRWWHEKLGNYMQTPIVLGDLGYFFFDNGVLTVVDMETGERVHQERIGRGSGGFSGSPVATKDKIFLGSEDGDVFVLEAGREPKQLAMNELGETFMSTPAISGDLLLLRARNHLFAIGSAARPETSGE